MSKEEKAKEYAEQYPYDAELFGSDLRSVLEGAFISGYARAEQDLSSQLTACKEALREFIGIEERCLGLNQNKTWVSETEILQIIDKAKTLIENWQEESHKNDK